MNNTRGLCFTLFALFTPPLTATETTPCKEIVYYAKSFITQHEHLVCYNDHTLRIERDNAAPLTVNTEHATWWRVIRDVDAFSAGLSFTHDTLRYTFYTLHHNEEDLAGLIITQNAKLVSWATFEPHTVLHVIDNHLTHFGLKEYRPFPHRH